MLWAMSVILLPMVYSRIFMVLSLTFMSLIQFEFIFVYGVKKGGLISLFCMYLSNFLNIIYWVDSLYLTVCFCLLCQILIDVKVWVYFWALYSVPLIYMSVFMPVPCSIVLCQVVWFLKLCSFSRLLWLFRLFCSSMYIFGILVLVLWNTPLVSW